MNWKTVRQCEYRGYTITDTGAGFWIHRPNGTSMGETWSVDDAMDWIDREDDAMDWIDREIDAMDWIDREIDG